MHLRALYFDLDCAVWQHYASVGLCVLTPWAFALKALLGHAAPGATAYVYTLITGACPYNRPCAQQYVGKSQSCMVISGRLIVHAPV